jgi:hypothetical protein
MKPEGKIGEVLDRALGRLGVPATRAVESARARVLLKLRTGNPPEGDNPLPPLSDIESANLWELRKPFFVFAAVALGVVLLSVLAFRTEIDSASPDAVAVNPIATSSEVARVTTPPETPPAPVVPVQREPEPRRVRREEPAPKLDAEPLSAVPAPVLEARLDEFSEGPGKEILRRSCASCHAAESVRSRRFESRVEYEDLVSRMVTNGAVMSPSETSTLVDYLYDQFGTGPKDAGFAVLQRACTTCHSLNPMRNQVFDNPEAYSELVRMMISYGAEINEDELASLTNYLFKTYGNK